jgi:hypothetical protein
MNKIIFRAAALTAGLLLLFTARAATSRPEAMKLTLAAP